MKTALLSILVLTLISCDASSKEFTGSSWKVVELKSNGTIVNNTNDVILTVNSESEFSLKLDVNTCSGTYKITGKNTITLGEMACTKMCCDSEFSEAVVQALYKVSNIKVAKDEAILSSNDVKITFKRQKEVLQVAAKTTNEAEESMDKTKAPATPSTLNVDNLQGTSNIEIPTGDFIELYKSPCKGTCEEFYMRFYEDGTVIYTGKYNAEVQGRHSVKLMVNKAKSLFTEFEQSNFMSFQEKYDDPNIMDIQNTHLTYKGKKVEMRYIHIAPKALQTLLSKVETEAKVALEMLKKRQ